MWPLTQGKKIAANAALPSVIRNSPNKEWCMLSYKIMSMYNAYIIFLWNENLIYLPENISTLKIPN